MPPRKMAEDLWGNGTDVLLTDSSGWSSVHTREPQRGSSQVRTGASLPQPHAWGRAPAQGAVGTVGTSLRMDNRGKAKAPPILPEPGIPDGGSQRPHGQPPQHPTEHSQATSLSWPHDSVYLN